MKRIASIVILIVLAVLLITPAEAAADPSKNPNAVEGEALLAKVVVSDVVQSTTDPKSTMDVTVELSNLNKQAMNGIMVSVNGLSADTLTLTDTYGPFSADLKAEDTGNINFKLYVSSNILGANIPLTLRLTYVDKDGITSSVDRNISILIDRGTGITGMKPGGVSAPYIVITSYNISEDQVYGGDKFELSFTLKNTSDTIPLHNVMISFLSEANAFATVSGSSNQLYINDITAGGSYTGKITLEASKTIPDGFYKLNLNLQYQDASNTIYNAATSISVLVNQEEKETDPSAYITPQLVVSSYNVGTDQLFSGNEFELTFTVRNTSSDIAVSNVLLNYTSELNAFTPSPGSSNQLYIGNINAGGSYTGKLYLKSDNTLQSGDYSIDFGFQYQDSYKNSYNSTANISLTVSQKQKMNVSSVSVSDNCVLGSRALLNISFSNPGTTDLKNVAVNLTGEILDTEKTLSVGTVKAGGSGVIDQYITPLSAGQKTIEVSFTFEDEKGNTYSSPVKSVSLIVSEPVAETPDNMSSADGTPVVNDSPFEKITGALLNSYWLYIVIAGVVLAAAAIVLGIMVRKKKQKAAWK